MKRRKKNSHDYQAFEDRCLLATDITMSLDNGVLSIEGYAQDDAVYVRYFEDDVLVRYGVRGSGSLLGERFAVDDVSRIEFRGSSGNDAFINSTSLDSLAYGGSGDDVMRGGSGTDSFYGGNDNDNMMGNDGVDDLHGDAGDDWLDGGAGDDEVLGWTGDDTLRGGDGNDYISGYIGNDWAHGGNGDDIIRGHEGNDRLLGGAGNDEIYGWLGDDRLFGGFGDDFLSGYTGNDHIAGNEGSDTLKGHEGEDRLFGGDGSDRIFGWDGWDLLDGGNGNDELWGGEHRDTLVGGDGNDIIHGDNGSDWLSGGNGDDILVGFNGHDRLVGGAGADLLNGGYNNDIYVEIDDEDIGFDPDSPFASEGVDHIDKTLEARAWYQYRIFLESLQSISERLADDGSGAWLPSIDFDQSALGEKLSDGDQVSDQWAWWGMHISTSGETQTAMIDGSTYRRTVLVVDGGGTAVFDFDRAVKLDQVGLTNIGEESAVIRLYGSDGLLFKEVTAGGNGELGEQLIDVDGDHVQKMTIELSPAVALTNIIFSKDS